MQCRKNNQISNIFFSPPRGKPLLEEEKTHSNGKLNSILHWFTSIHKTHSIFRSDGGNSPDGGLLTILVAPSRIAGKCLQVVPHFAVNGVRCRYAEKRYISSSHRHSHIRFPSQAFSPQSFSFSRWNDGDISRGLFWQEKYWSCSLINFYREKQNRRRQQLKDSKGERCVVLVAELTNAIGYTWAFKSHLSGFYDANRMMSWIELKFRRL